LALSPFSVFEAKLQLVTGLQLGIYATFGKWNTI